MNTNVNKYISILKILAGVFIILGICVYLFSETMTAVRWIPLFLGLICLLIVIVYDFHYISNKVTSRSFKYTTNAVIYSLIIIAIVIVINFIVFKNDKQWDLTQNKRYSLSPQSIKVLKGLKSNVEVLMFYPDISKLQFNDLFKQYSYHSDKFQVTYYDINKNPKLAQQYNVTESQTAVIKYKDKTEKLYGTFGEQELTNAIIRATREKKKVIYFLTGHNEADCDSMTEKGLTTFKDALISLNYEVKKVNLIQEQKVPDDCSALIICGPQTELFDNEVNYISSYLDTGGKVFILLDIKPAASLDNLLSKYGIEAGADLVIDPKPALKLFGLGDYTIPLGMLYDQSHSITKDFNIATLHPLVRSINFKSQPGLVHAALVKTSPETYADKTYLTEPNIKFDPNVDTKGPITLMVACSKTIHEATLVNSTNENELKSDPEGEKKKKKEMRLVVGGTSNIIRNRYVGIQGNGNLALNVINYLAEEEDIIAIKPKTNTPQEKIDLTQKDADNIFYLTILLMPGFIVLSGFTVWFYNKNR